MPTFDSKSIIDEMVKNDGRYPRDPQALLICSFKTDAGKEAYHVSYNRMEIQILSSSPNVHKIKILWSSKRINISVVDGKLTILT